jgi:hypothetical protein
VQPMIRFTQIRSEPIQEHEDSHGALFYNIILVRTSTVFGMTETNIHVFAGSNVPIQVIRVGSGELVLLVVWVQSVLFPLLRHR